MRRLTPPAARVVIGLAVVGLAAGCGAEEPVTTGAPPPSTTDPSASAADDAALAGVLAASTVAATAASWRVAAPVGADGSLADDVAAVMCDADARWLSGGVEQVGAEPRRQTQRVWGLAIPDLPREASTQLGDLVEERATVARAAFGTGIEEAEVVHVELRIPAPVPGSSPGTGPVVVQEVVLELVGDGSSVSHLAADDEATRLTYTGEALDVAGVRRLARTLADLTGADVDSVVVRPADTSRGC